MKKTVHLPAMTVTIDTDKDLPQGTGIFIHVPIKKTVTQENDTIEVIPQEPQESTPNPVPEPIEQENHGIRGKIYSFTPDQPMLFRKQLMTYETIGNAKELGICDNITRVEIKVSFPNFDHHHRVIGSESIKGNGSSLQIGVLQGGRLWMDVFGSGMTGPLLEIDKFYKITAILDPNGDDTLMIDDEVVSRTSLIPFESQSNLLIGKWVNTFADFDLKSLEIFIDI